MAMFPLLTGLSLLADPILWLNLVPKTECPFPPFARRLSATDWILDALRWIPGRATINQAITAKKSIRIWGVFMTNATVPSPNCSGPTFDDALAYIPDASVDLLHIDGFHTYEAVRHDFESWQHKLSDSAVVLFHDTNVREGDFGVWRLWEELSSQFPRFEFPHGHGLGILAVGHSILTQVGALCSLRDPACIHAIRERFSLLGERWILLDQRQHLEQLRAGEIAGRDARILSLEAEAAQLTSELADSKAERQELEQLRVGKMAARDARIRSLETEIAQFRFELTRRTVFEEKLRIRASHRAKEARAEAARAAEAEQARVGIPRTSRHLSQLTLG
jgi:hypothetical protein